MSTEDREGLAAIPPTSPGDPNTPEALLGLPQGGERDPGDAWGPDYGKPPPTAENSPHWAEIKT